MDSQPPNHAYTILRIKRKRTDEPLDALVIESKTRRKKSRGGLDVFQFAQTVENDAWEDDLARQHLESQISRLAQDSNESAKAQISPGREVKPPIVPPRTENGAPRYAVKMTGVGEDARPKRRPTSPPKVISAKDIPRNDFRMYDAVLEDQSSSLPPMDSEMEKFLPMLQDYLTLQDATSRHTIPNSNMSGNDAATGNDYVWDVFYRRPYTMSEWNAFAANFGTVTGLPPSAEDDELSDYSEEEEDEADEDSNAEEYYKNDYPDEEESDSADSDILHDDSEDEDFFSDPADSDHDWR